MYPNKEKLRRLVEAANHARAVKPMLKGWRTVVALVCDGEPHQIVLNGVLAELAEEASAKADISFEMSGTTLDALMTGELTPLKAKLRGEIRSSGSIVSILRFASLLSAAVKAMPTDGRSEVGKGVRE